ncbi:AAA family ATPase [Paenibacillus urinalis]|uniref:AAA family ATPase n=1 Tax=Paenibacillus urinalis TaxID=521520 RepID=UPI0019609002
MDHTEKTSSVYLISGPLGVGKSTVSKALADTMNQCALIEGDLLLHIYRGDTEPEWEERLRIAWLNITAVARNLIQNGIHVVIDFVVEDELEWFCEQLSDLGVTIHYAVLHAEPDTLNTRLHQRGDGQYIERSLFLRNKLISSSSNQAFLLDAGHKRPDELAQEIVENMRFRLNEPVS